MTSMKKARIKRLFCLTLIVLSYSGTVAQSPVENHLLWEVSGNGLKQPSYLFGTFHLLGSQYIDSLANVMTKFNSSRTFVGELLFDSTMTIRMMSAAVMKDSTLNQVLGEEWYAKTSDWFRELSGMPLEMFKNFNPTTINIMMMSMLYQQTDKQSRTPMDLHFQALAKKQKKLIGLETIDMQIEVLYGSTTYRQQAAHLIDFVKDKTASRQQLFIMTRLYREQNLSGLQALSFTDTHTQREKAVLLDNRNAAWAKVLPDLFREQSTFVAVGALHLAGEEGLVTLLRQLGFNVKPLPLQ
jgi:uncharacterized protein